MTKNPGIFNDVIGPVMRGPSSSHTAASWRIAKTSLSLLDGDLKSALIEFDKNGAWATNYRQQGTTMGINGGLLGLEMTDDRMVDTDVLAEEKNIQITYELNSFPTSHTNTVRLTLENDANKKIQIVAVSLGGGSFKIRSFNGFDVSLKGDSNELLIILTDENYATDLKNQFENSTKVKNPELENFFLVILKSFTAFEDSFINQILINPGTDEVFRVKPVMPIVSGRETALPFDSIQSMLDYAQHLNLDLGQMGLLYEKCRSGL